jgi:putative oxidoreductase
MEECDMQLPALCKSLRAALETFPYALIALLARVAVALVFWRSGQTKVDGWQITDTTFLLFREEYQVPVIPPEIAAYMATVSEHLLSALLVVGLFSRISALGLLGMTAVIQLFVYPSHYPEHLLWAALLVLIVARGPGALSLDRVVWR